MKLNPRVSATGPARSKHLKFFTATELTCTNRHYKHNSASENMNERAQLPYCSLLWAVNRPASHAKLERVKCMPLMVKGILYLTIPDHVFAIDAHTGDELWHYDWQDQGGHLVGNRGVGLYGDWPYFQARVLPKPK